MPKAKVFPRYSDLLNEMIENNFYISEAIKLKNQRDWMFPELGDWDGDPHHITGSNSLQHAFDRDEINSVYIDALRTGGDENGGRITDCKSCKMQGDYIAADERATSLRYATSIRCSMMASGARRGGHSSSKGIFANLIKNVADNIADGYQGV